MRDEDLNLKAMLASLQDESSNDGAETANAAPINPLAAQAPQMSPLASLLAAKAENTPEEALNEDSDAATEAEPQEETPVTPPAAIAPVEKTPLQPTIQSQRPLADAELIAAQEAADKNRLYAGLGRAAAQVGGALAAVGSHGITAPSKPDVSQFEELQKTAESPVASLMTRRQAATQQVQQQNLQTMADPNSAVSKQMRSLFNKYMPSIKMPDNVSALDIEKSNYGKYAEQLAAIELKSKEHASNIQQKREDAQTKLQDKAQADALKDANNFRSNRAVQQAALDTYSAAKALNLVKGKDLNNLTIQDLRLLNSEIAKIATGGVPGEHGTQALMPENLQTRLADFQNFISSNPSPANAAAYVRKNMHYLEDMVNTAQSRVKAFQDNALKSKARQMGKERYDEAKQILEETQRSQGIMPETKQEDPVQAYADKYLGGNYKAAVELLKKRGQL